jgi:hypothetical protein
VVAFAGALATLAAGVASAHGLGMSQLRVRVDGPRLDGEWDIQLRDARRAVGLGIETSGEAGWGELAPREASLRAYLARRIFFDADGAACVTEIAAAPAWQPDSSQLTYRIVSSCPVEPRRLGMRCDVFFDFDPSHRAYYSVQDARVTDLGLFRSEARVVRLDIHHFHAGSDFVEFVREGVRHIWTGLDHLLFLLALLLPAPLARAGGQWSPRPGLAAAAREVLKVVTAFTVAHSLTLGLAFFGLVSFRAQWVEVAIALSVFAAAWNNLRPFLPGRAWAMALAFGLVHGLGFAGALRNLALPIRARGLALAAFNVGVELGQLAIVAPLLPLLYAASRRRFYARFVMGTGSLLIAWLAVLWMLERAFGLPVFGRS